MNVIEGNKLAVGKKFAIVVSRFNSFIVESLLLGALDELKRTGGVKDDDITIIRVPGAYELPLAAKRVAAKKQFDAIIAIGAVIRGGTPHFEYVSGEASSGISKVGLEYNIPVANGVLTVNSIEQAIERSGTKAGNKGEEAALTILEVLTVFKQIQGAE